MRPDNELSSAAPLPPQAGKSPTAPRATDELQEAPTLTQAISQAAATISHTPDQGDRQATHYPRAEGVEGPLPEVPGHQILGVLGRGGMGIVYLARQSGLNRLVALKMILAGVYAGDGERRRFVNEAQAVARLRHPNIVQIHQTGEHDGLPYFSLEFCDAGSLAVQLRGTPLRPADAAQLIRTLAEAMQAAHDAGIVHRDLKPANVLLTNIRGHAAAVTIQEPLGRIGSGATPAGSETKSQRSAARSGSNPASAATTGHWLQCTCLKISDFGLAKNLNETGHTADGAIVGTPSYMAPEQAGGESQNQGPPADIYALGAMLYESLTGRPPFKGATPLDTVMAVVHSEPVPPAQLNPKVPRDLETICLKCLQKTPAKRYASAGDLAEDLRRFQAGEPIRARPVGWLERTGKWVRKRPMAAAFVGLLMLVVSAVVAAGFWYQQIRFDQAQAHADEQARLELRKEGAQSDILAALEEIASSRKAIQDKLSDPIAAAELNSDLHGWKAALDQAQAVWTRADRLGAGNSDVLDTDLTLRVQTAGALLRADSADWALARELDDIRTDEVRMVQNKVDTSLAGPRYASLFARLGLDIATGEPADIAAAIRAKPTRHVLVSALDYWALVSHDPKVLLPRLLETSRLADPHPWRDQARDVRNWRSKKNLEKLVQQVVYAENSPQFLAVIAVLQRDRGSDATALLTGALRHYPKDFWLNFQRSVALKPMTARVECLRSCLIIRPKSAIAHSNLGLALNFTGDLEGSVYHLEKAIEYDRGFAGAHLNLGVTLQKKKDLKGAVAQFTQAVELDPRYVGAHVNLAEALRDSQDLKGALVHFQKAVELAPDDARPRSHLAYFLRETKDLKGSIVHYKAALKLDPSNAASHNNLANALRDTNDLDGAIVHYKEAIKNDSTLAEAYSNLGAVFRTKKKLKKAIFYHQEAVKLKPDVAGMQHNLAAALRDNLEWEQAIVHFKKATELDPSFVPARQGLVTAYVNFGLMLAGKKDFATAIVHFENALAIDSKHAVIHFHFANVLRDNKERDRAIVEYKKSIALDANYPRPCYQLGVLLLNQGKFEEAHKFLDAGHKLGFGRPKWNLPSAQKLKECERLLKLDRQLTAVLAGKATVSSPAEALQLADLCVRYKQQYAAATRFYESAFRKNPEDAEDPGKGHRARAWRAAVRAGTGQGADAGALQGKEGTALLQQARTWLRADLRLHATALQAKDFKRRVAAADAMSLWQRDPDLAAVRDEQHLAKLPADEQKAWTVLWHEVDDAQKTLARRFTASERQGVLGPKQPEFVLEFTMRAGRTYVIDLESSQFDAYLRLETATRKVLAENDDIGPENQNSRLIFTPPSDGTYRIVATSFQQQRGGAYTLRVRHDKHDK